MNVFNDVLYEDNAVVTLVLYDTKLLLMNIQNDVLYEDNADVTLIV